MSCLMETSSQLMDSSVIFESMQQYWRSLIMSGSNVLVCFVYTHNWFVAITQVPHGQLVVLRRFPRQPSETEREQNSLELRGDPSGSAHLRFFAKHQLMLQDHWYVASALRGVPVYSPTFAGIHYACPQRDGQTELTWKLLDGYFWHPVDSIKFLVCFVVCCNIWLCTDISVDGGTCSSAQNVRQFLL